MIAVIIDQDMYPICRAYMYNVNESHVEKYNFGHPWTFLKMSKIQDGRQQLSWIFFNWIGTH